MNFIVIGNILFEPYITRNTPLRFYSTHALYSHTMPDYCVLCYGLCCAEALPSIGSTVKERTVLWNPFRETRSECLAVGGKFVVAEMYDCGYGQQL